MIVLDTNVISEMMRVDPDPTVMQWVNGAGRLHTTSVAVAEVEYGLARLPADQRKTALVVAARRLFADFREVILPFDADAAHHYGEIVVARNHAGRPITMADAQIAAICVSRDAVLATRNSSDFESTGTSLADPWRDPPPAG